MRLVVTQTDIDLALKNSSCNCPIAKSMQRRFPNKAVEVFHRFLTLGDFSSSIIQKTCWNIPPRAKNFINQFDIGKKVKPFHFTIKDLECPK